MLTSIRTRVFSSIVVSSNLRVCIDKTRNVWLWLQHEGKLPNIQRAYMYLDPTIDSRSLDPRISKTFRVDGRVEFRDVRACSGYCPRSSWNIRDEKQTIFGVIALFEVQSVWSDLTFTLLILILPVGKICSGRKTWFEWVHQSVNLDQRIQVSNWSKGKNTGTLLILLVCN